jgi:hypothetical protein
VNNPQGGMGRSALGDLKFVGRPLGLRLRQGQDKRVALLVFLHFYPAFEMLSQFRDAFQIGFLDDDFYGVFGAPELASDHARLEPSMKSGLQPGKAVMMPNMALSSLISGMAVSSLKMFQWARVP